MKLVKLLPVALATACIQTGDVPSPNPPPSWGVPISGGTITVSRDGKHVVVADADRDRILIVELGVTDRVVSELALEPSDEPGRVIEDGQGRFHVALRRGGALLTLDAAGQVLARRAVCAEPRGIAYEATTDLVHVACATGELSSFPAAGGAPTRTKFLERDLRDVIVRGSDLVVTKFRSAELLKLDAQGNIVARVLPPTVHRFNFGGDFDTPSDPDMIEAKPAVAWRTIAMPDGRLVTVHQRQLNGVLKVTTGGYGQQGCGDQDRGPAQAGLSVFAPDTLLPSAVAPMIHGALPVDIAVNPNGTELAVAFAGAKNIQLVRGVSLNVVDDDKCGGPDDGDRVFNDDLGAPTSVGWTAGNDLVVYYPELPALVVHPNGSNSARTVVLPGPLGYDSGRNLFHTETATGLSCASCHPEGRDDGLVWKFDKFGTRRTQNLAGNILMRAPYHWTGDEHDLGALMADVFAQRMSGGEPTRSEKLSLGPWLDRLPAPAPAPMLDPDAVARGAAIFESTETQCTTCHKGAILTNKAVVAVGTNGSFKVPSLVGIGARAPFMHDGCAKTLHDRFGAYCGGGDNHGHTSQLTPAQIDDLVAFLESL